MSTVRIRVRRVLAALAATVSVAVLGWAAPAYADGSRSDSIWDATYTGSFVVVTLQWQSRGNGYYNIQAFGSVYDMEADGYAAVAQLKYYTSNGTWQYPIIAKAPSNHTVSEFDFGTSNVKSLYVRSCLHKVATGPVHCGEWE